MQTDDELDAFVREHAESAYHPCGTARMGRASDPMAVVDPECRVIGVDGLRVADSSIFPQRDERQSERAVDHGGREGGGSCAGPHAACPAESGAVDQPAGGGRARTQR